MTRKEALSEIYPHLSTTKALKLSSEDAQQKHFFDYVRAINKPHYQVIHSIPNGSYKKSKYQQSLFKQTGLLKGAWDVFVPIPAGGYSGLYLEFKWTTTLSKEQEWFRDTLSGFYRFEVVYTAKQAVRVLENYLKGDLK